ncbi:MAG: hypothetical protein R3D60_02890 [Paracoccaceae bacterium]
MSAKKRQRVQRKSRERIRVYLYGSDREGASGPACFAGAGGAVVI